MFATTTIVLARASGAKAQHNGQRATYTAVGANGWTTVTLADGTALKWRTNQWTTVPLLACIG
jgi:hypothetical protein